RDQRRDYDHGFVREHCRRQLVAKRLSEAGRHYRADVVPTNQTAYHFLLHGPERVVAPETPECAAQFSLRNHVRSIVLEWARVYAYSAALKIFIGRDDRISTEFHSRLSIEMRDALGGPGSEIAGFLNSLVIIASYWATSNSNPDRILSGGSHEPHAGRE